MGSRFVVGAVVGALFLYAVGLFPGEDRERVSFASTPQSAPGATQASPQASYADDYAEFARLLGEFRAGDETDGQALRVAARRMAQAHGRGDAQSVADYFLALSPADRRRGLDAYGEVDEFHGRAQGLSAAQWKVERPLLLGDIETFVARTLPAPEFSAAGNALALASEIRVDWSAARADDDRARLTRARQEALEAIALFERAGMQTPKLRPLLQLGRLAVLEVREGDARDHFEACLQLARTCRQEAYEVDSLVALIRMARAAGDGPELESRLQDLAKVQTPQQSWQLAREHAMLWLHRDQPERAAQFLLRHRPSAAADLKVWRQVLASVRMRMGDLSGAQALLAGFAETSAIGDEDLVLLRATLDLARRDTAAVIAGLAASQEASTKYSQRGRSRAAVLVGEAYLLEGHAQLALEHLSQARQLAESWEARMEEARPSSRSGAAVLGEWLGMHAVVLEARALCNLNRPLEAAVLIERAHGFRWRRAARADRVAASEDTDSLDVHDLRAWAARFPLGLVTWISGADSALAVHVSNAGIASAMEINRPRRALKRAIARHRAALIEGNSQRQAELGRTLVETLFPAALIDALGAQAGAQDRLLLLPHGELEPLPFEALPWELEVLDERVALLTLPELPSRRPGVAALGHANWSLFGDPLDRYGVRRLPASAGELADLARLLPNANLFTGEALTQPALLAALRAGDSIHIATHLGPDPGCNPARFAAASLELSGGPGLCAETIASQITGSPLVVLATCSSAGGRQLDGRGLQGLSRAFLDAGTRNLLVTLWPVRDDVAAEFSLIYHRALFEGKAPSVAAREARRALAEKNYRPVDWAAFRALGRD